MPQPLEIPFPAAVWVEHLEDDGARIPASKRPVQRGAPVLMERLDGRVFLVGRRAHRVAEGLSAHRARWHRAPVDPPRTSRRSERLPAHQAVRPDGRRRGASCRCLRIARSTHTEIFSPGAELAKAAESYGSQAAGAGRVTYL